VECLADLNSAQCLAGRCWADGSAVECMAGHSDLRNARTADGLCARCSAGR
jgi:hypothetical protein